ncbi:MAG: sigma-54-dependent Fis family transcriptional regulator [Polyangiaceae bacterium]|nr:sigma-54-dependent Fis family transcriptional regulator [Polyangiaceae bacterium]
MANAKTKLLLVEDESGLREMLTILFKREGYDVLVARGVEEGKKHLAQKPDVVLSDIMMPDGSGLDLVTPAREVGAEIILMTAHSSIDTAIGAMKLGAYDFVQKPFANSEIKALLVKALEKRELVRENAALRKKLTPTRFTFGKSMAMRKVAELVSRAAPTKGTVLITGESGVGKERIARAVHDESDRKDKAFLVVNCGAIPEALMESELFGHEKGAFTGAVTKKIGIFQEADGGTVFLDEIGELPLPLQVKLLRALQEKKVRSVGATQEESVDVRVIAATNRNLDEMVKEKRFREDLFYRLNVIPIAVPPLRERREDIADLAESFLKRANEEHGRVGLSYSPDVLRAFDHYGFPGNVRELENIVERVVTLSSGDTIVLADLPGEIRPGHTPIPSSISLPEGGCDLDGVIASIERSLIESALARTHQSKSKAAELLGVNVRGLRYRMKKLGLLGEDDPDEDASSAAIDLNKD